MGWEQQAERLAGEIAHPVSRWRIPVAITPRHLFVPRWWEHSDLGTWTLCDGASDEQAWMDAAYSDQTLVTSVAGLHADHAQAYDRPSGLPTSSSTLPSLVLRMLRHSQVYEDAEVLDVGVGSGYGAAVLARRLGDSQVTSVDVDPYLTKAAGDRLESIGLRPHTVTCDATGPLPGTYDRIVSMVSVRPIPASWLAALRPGGRLVTTITNTSMIVTAYKDEDGGATGQVERDWAMFMTTRNGADYPPRLRDMFTAVRDQDGEHVRQGHYPVLDVVECWELRSMLELSAPDIEHHYEELEDGRRTAWMLHRDGSWARASAANDEPPIVHQGGPRRLWDLLEEVQRYWLRHGHFPLYGAKAFITPDGTVHLARGCWRATIG